MISKELLSEVLKESVLYIRPYIEDDIIDENITIYECGKNTYGIIDIYELAHKCKEWLEYNCFYEVMIVEYEVYLMEDIWGEGGVSIHKRFTSENSWILNLFKACEYIMENKCGS